MTNGKIEKIDDRTILEHWAEGKDPLRLTKEPELIRLKLEDAAVVVSGGWDAGIEGASPPIPPSTSSRTSIYAAARVLGQRTISILDGVNAHPRIQLWLQREASDSHRLSPGCITHITGDALKTSERTEPYLELIVVVPQRVFDPLLALLERGGVGDITVYCKVDAFRSNVDRSFAEPWDHQRVFLLSGSFNEAWFSSLSASRALPEVRERHNVTREKIPPTARNDTDESRIEVEPFHRKDADRYLAELARIRLTLTLIGVGALVIGALGVFVR